MGDYLLLIIADLLLACNFAINKIYQNKAGISLKAGFGFNSLLGLFTAGIFFAINGFKCGITTYSILMIFLRNAFYIAYIIVGFRILKVQGMSIYTLFLMTGGMIVPYIWGVEFLNESISIFKVLGLLFIIGGVIASTFSGEKIKPQNLILCMVLFLLNGGVSVVSKLHSVESAYKTVSVNEFIILGGVISFILSGVGYLVAKPVEKRNVEKRNVDALSLSVITAMSALLGGMSYMIQLIGARSLPATVLYPFVTGGSMIFSAIAGRLFFKEKLTKNIIVSLILCFVGTLLFL